MSLSIFLLWLVSIPLLVHSVPAPRGFLVNCGSSEPVKVGDLEYIPDDGFIPVGRNVSLNKPDLFSILKTLRYFPDTSARKFCYVVPVIKGGKYFVRTTYYYGGFDGGNAPPVFDQIIGGTKWSVVNTTDDYINGMSSYYEIIVGASGKTLSVCLARNQHTVSSPFISALEVEYLDDPVYNSTDFDRFALSTVARSAFGDEDPICFPDDPFNRVWQPFTDNNPVVISHSNVTASDFWNNPPGKAFWRAVTTSRGKNLEVKWPPLSLPSTQYYVALYFQENRSPSPYSWRVFSISVNGKNFYSGLNVTTQGVTVYSTQWPLSGQTQITLIPDPNSTVGPVMNAAEILQILPLGGRTLTKDVIVMEELARSFDNPPADWRGDPCLPPENSWTGVTCSKNHAMARVISLNLTNLGVSGSLPPMISNLRALRNLWLGGNQLSGTIPEMGSLTQLETLHLENNKLTGPIPQSLSSLQKLREIFLQNNNLDGSMPPNLQGRNGLNIQVTPGNHLRQPA